MNLQLEGRRALVCGASRGIGRAVAQALAGLGAEVVAVARDGKALARVVGGLPAEHGQQHTALAVDLADGEALEAALQPVVDSAPVHIVLNNSGGPPAGAVTEAAIAEFEAAFAQHVLAAQRILGLVLPGMCAAGYGRVVNIISTSVKEPIPGLGVSNTVRGAMASWAKTVSREVAPYGITVNNVLPGFTATDRLDYLFELQARKRGESVEAVRERAITSVPAKRFAAPEEIASAVAFLTSPAAAYITGINLPVDGGRTGSL